MKFFGTTIGSLGLPVSTVPAEKLVYLSAITCSSTAPASTVQPRMTMQWRSFAPGAILAPEEMMQSSISPSINQLSATRLLRDMAFSP